MSSKPALRASTACVSLFFGRDRRGAEFFEFPPLSVTEALCGFGRGEYAEGSDRTELSMRRLEHARPIGVLLALPVRRVGVPALSTGLHSLVILMRS